MHDGITSLQQHHRRLRSYLRAESAASKIKMMQRRVSLIERSLQVRMLIDGSLTDARASGSDPRW